MISEYASGQCRWVLSLMFIAYGASSLTRAITIRSHLNAHCEEVGLAMPLVSGIGQASAAHFDLNQAVLHELAGVVGILCLPVVSRKYRTTGA